MRRVLLVSSLADTGPGKRVLATEPRRKDLVRGVCLTALLATLVLSAALPLPAVAQSTEAQAQATAAELSALVSSATDVVGALQPAINGGTAASQVKPDALLAAFATAYQKKTGKPLDRPDSPDAETRRTFNAALKEVFVKYEPVMAKGGTDAFVPAFFRAEVLKRFNAGMKGKVQGYATNRDSDLLNADWSVKQVMKGSPLAGEVTALMSAGTLDPVNKRVGDRVMLYAPMKLGAQCVACHARNNLQQKEGAFGGAFVAEVWLKP
jgi:hypothetical protein